MSIDPKSVKDRVAAWMRAAVARVRASAWGFVAVRALAAVCALLLLAWIGRTATAGAPIASIASPEAAPLFLVDGGGLEPPSDAGATMAAAVALPNAANTAIAAPAVPEGSDAGGAARSGPRPRATPTEPVFVNQADADELRRLPGVGAKRAEAILALRRRLGRFSRVEDLLRVKGVGRTTLKKWRPLLRLDDASASGSADGGSS